MSNSTTHYERPFIDHFDGEMQACNGDPAYEVACFYVNNILGPIYVLQGAWLLFSAYKEKKRINVIAEATSREQLETPSREKANPSLFIIKLKLTICLNNVCLGGTYFFLAHYPSIHPLGRVTDVFLMSYFSSTFVLLFMQRQGAKWFDEFVRKPGLDSVCHNRTLRNKTNRYVHKAVKFIVCKVIPPVVAGLWILLFAGKIGRETCYNGVTVSQVISGVYTIYVLVTKRASVLMKVATVHKRTSVEGRVTSQKRHNALKNKIHGLLFDAFSVFAFLVLLPTALFLFSAYASSRRNIVIQLGTGTIGVLSQGLLLRTLRAKDISKQKCASARASTRFREILHGGENTDRNESKFDSGMSVVKSSIVFISPAIVPRNEN